MPLRINDVAPVYTTELGALTELEAEFLNRNTKKVVYWS